MIFQNFGFNRQSVRAVAAQTFNYVTSGAQVIYDFGNTSSYPGSGTSVFDVSGNSGPTATLRNSPTFSSANGGVMQFAQASSQYWDFTGTITSDATFMFIWKNTNVNNLYYFGYPCLRAADGYIFTLDINTSGKIATAIAFDNSNSGTTFSTANIAATDIQVFHAYTSTVDSISTTSTTVLNYIDTTASASDNRSFNRTSNSASGTIFLNRDTAVAGRYGNGICMGYLQYNRVLSAAEVAQNLAVFSSRF